MVDTIDEALMMLKEVEDFLFHYREMRSNPNFHEHSHDLKKLIERIEEDQD